MATDKQSKNPSTRRYSPAEREQAVRLVRQLRKELGTDQGTVGRVARQLGYGVESVRSWVYGEFSIRPSMENRRLCGTSSPGWAEPLVGRCSP
jgi:hypothetical protein